MVCHPKELFKERIASTSEAPNIFIHIAPISAHRSRACFSASGSAVISECSLLPSSLALNSLPHQRDSLFPSSVLFPRHGPTSVNGVISDFIP